MEEDVDIDDGGIVFCFAALKNAATLGAILVFDGIVDGVDDDDIGIEDDVEGNEEEVGIVVIVDGAGTVVGPFCNNDNNALPALFVSTFVITGAEIDDDDEELVIFAESLINLFKVFITICAASLSSSGNQNAYKFGFPNV